MQREGFGIYLNLKERKVVRINSPYWIPEGQGWVLLAPEVNATLVQVREIAREKGLVDQPGEITWGDILHRKERS